MNLLLPLAQVTAAVEAPVCSHGDCRSSHWKRWKGRREGILFNASWYCGRECLEVALTRFLESVHPGPGERRSVHRLPLGLLLLSRGNIDQEHLLRALKQKGENPSSRIGECLAALGAVSEAQITRALGVQNCLPVLLSRDVTLNGEVPMHLQRANDAICCTTQYPGEVICVAFGIRAQTGFVKAVEFMTGRPVEPCMTPLSFVQQCWEQSASRCKPAEVVFDRSCSGLEITSTIVSYASQVGCERLRAVNTGGWLWAELDGGKEPIHLMFRLASAKET